MNVLSLFDGMSCGQIALSKLGARVDNYFASEIDEKAMFIAKKNFPNIKHVGSVEFVTKEMFVNYNIDLLFGGSPCQSFSKQGGGSGFDGSSRLFWEYVRVLREIKPKYFLLENVKMKKEWQNIITQAVGVEPIEVDSSLMSGQSRNRMYWTNIPGVKAPVDRGIMASDSIIPEFSLNYPNYLDLTWCGVKRIDKLRHIQDPKAACLTATMWKGNHSSFIRNGEEVHRLTAEDCERLQTVPVGYTKGVANMHRLTMLGNGWTVDVIAHILSHMPIYKIPIFEVDAIDSRGEMSQLLIAAIDEDMFEILGENGWHDYSVDDIFFFMENEKEFYNYPYSKIEGYQNTRLEEAMRDEAGVFLTMILFMIAGIISIFYYFFKFIIWTFNKLFTL